MRGDSLASLLIAIGQSGLGRPILAAGPISVRQLRRDVVTLEQL